VRFNECKHIYSLCNQGFITLSLLYLSQIPTYVTKDLKTKNHSFALMWKRMLVIPLRQIF
jgi:hypothetical protein